LTALGFTSKDRVPCWKVFHSTTKAGPNGTAILTAKEDLSIIPSDLLQDLRDVGGTDFSEKIGYYLKNPEVFYDWKIKKGTFTGFLRKLSVVKDTEGKSRIIAIGDYWSQTVLKPLHIFLLEKLRGIESDVTFGQSIAPFGDSSQHYYSFDLTAATDRVPVLLYSAILRR
jgi:hypothetical protein